MHYRMNRETQLQEELAGGCALRRDGSPAKKSRHVQIGRLKGEVPHGAGQLQAGEESHESSRKNSISCGSNDGLVADDDSNGDSDEDRNEYVHQIDVPPLSSSAFLHPDSSSLA